MVDGDGLCTHSQNIPAAIPAAGSPCDPYPDRNSQGLQKNPPEKPAPWIVLPHYPENRRDSVCRLNLTHHIGDDLIDLFHDRTVRTRQGLDHRPVLIHIRVLMEQLEYPSGQQGA